mgnify:CR=1 FL=1
MKPLFSTFKVGGWTFASRILGLLRDISTTNLLGASVFHDVFVVILKIPMVFRGLFAEGAFSQAFIPVYKSLITKNKHADSKIFVDSLFTIMLISLFFITLLALIFAPVIVFIFAPGFYFESETKTLAVDLLRIMFPYLGLISLVSFAAGIQNSNNYFSVPAATPLIFNLVLIAISLFFARHFEIPVIALAWGVLLSGFLQLMIQIFPLIKLKIIPKISFNFNNQYIKKFLILILPALIAGGVSQINLLIDTIFASYLRAGSPTWLYVSDRLMQFPLGIFAVAISVVLLPTLTKSFANNNLLEFESSLLNGIKLVAFVAIPSTLGLIIFGHQILDMLFRRGEFMPYDISMSFLSLQMLAFGLPFFMLIKVLIPAFFAQQDTKTPLQIAILSLLLNIILNYIFAFSLGFGHYGLALGSSIAAFISGMLLILKLKHSSIIKFNKGLVLFFVRILVASIVMSFFLLIIDDVFNFSSLNSFWNIVITILCVLFSVIIYLSSSYLLGIRAKEFY